MSPRRLSGPPVMTSFDPDNRRGRMSSRCSEARTEFMQATAAILFAGMSDRTSSTATLEETHYEARATTTSCWDGGTRQVERRRGRRLPRRGALRDTAHAGAGDDTVVAREGRDALFGREGNDRLDAADSSHNDLINGGPGSTVVDSTRVIGSFAAR